MNFTSSMILRWQKQKILDNVLGPEQNEGKIQYLFIGNERG